MTHSFQRAVDKWELYPQEGQKNSHVTHWFLEKSTLVPESSLSHETRVK